MFTIPADPGVPQDVLAVQIEHGIVMGSCIVTVFWQSPYDLFSGDDSKTDEGIKFKIFANGTNMSNDSIKLSNSNNETRFSTLLTMPGCANHTISISAVDICGREGPKSAGITLDPDMCHMVPNNNTSAHDCTNAGVKANSLNYMTIMLLSIILMTDHSCWRLLYYIIIYT